MTVSDTIGRAGCILLVEDDPDAAEFFCRVLRSGSGFEVVHELGAEGALCRVRSGKHWDLDRDPGQRNQCVGQILGSG